MLEPQTPSRTHKYEKAKKKAFVFNARKKSRRKKKAPRDVPHLTDVSSIAKYYRTLLRFPRPVLPNPPSKAPTSPAEAKLFAGAKTGLSAAPWWPAKAYAKRQARLVIKSLDAVKHRADRFGCVACANGTAEILICFVCKKVKCVQYTTKITATLHLLWGIFCGKNPVFKDWHYVCCRKGRFFPVRGRTRLHSTLYRWKT